jgi:vacuolar-type H+-ATPase subunit D/Vma8
MAPTGVSAAAAETASAFEELAELLLAAANREALLRRLGEALARTSRQVNTLERRLGPALRADLASIRRTLDEREREEHLRLERLLRARQGRA